MTADWMRSLKAKADRAMCVDDECPSSQDCVRFMARPAKYQTISEFPRAHDAERCDHFISVEKGDG